MSTNRNWMWHQKDDKGYLHHEFIEGVKGFLEFAYDHPTCVSDNKIRCPCSKCRNRKFLNKNDVRYHLVKHGFTRGYEQWYAHGEPLKKTNDCERVHNNEEGSRYRNMVIDGMDQSFDWITISNEQPPNSEAQKFFDLLKDADEPLWNGCKNHTKLSAVTQLLNLKSEYNLPEACYDRLMSIIKSMLPESDNLPPNLYKTKKQLSNLGLGYKKIDACVNNYILYYKEYKDYKECPICFHPRYKPRKPRVRKEVPFHVLRYLPLIPRLKRLYASAYTCEHMTWHAKNHCIDGKMAHPSHGEAWKHFDRTYSSFASDPRNVRLGLCTDGFSPFGHQSTPYSCWPVIITVYNLPPWMCMQKPFMFLNMVIPGPKSPGKNIDVFLHPLIDELRELWTTRVQTYDVCSKQNFQMKAALLWTISDFPAYAMLSGWSTHGWLACPYCMEHTKSFQLKCGRKASWFDCHRQFLPRDHPFRRQAYKFRKGKVEIDSPPLRLSGKDIYQRVNRLPHVTFGKPPSATQPIDGFGKTHNWVKRSIFWELPYWQTNLIRHNLDVMHIEKNVFDNVFNTIMDVKDKTKDNAKARKDLEQLCSRPELHLIEHAHEHMEQIGLNIIEIICKLERIFPPAFFDSMEHMIIHLAYEAKVGGPVHYRWMYPFERFLYHLKKKVGNRARVEASIVEAYMIEEVSTFCSSNFEPHIQSRLNRIPRNDDGGAVDSSSGLPIFTHPGRALSSRISIRYLKDDELKAAHRYILMNIQEHPFEVDDDIKKLAHGPNRRVSSHKGYFVNGFKFETMEHGRFKATSNYGICVLGSTINEYEVDYYGVLEEILELNYYGLKDVIVLFKCHWYDTSDKGMKVHRLGLVEINHKSKLNTNDPFILAAQAQQVYYTRSPTIKQERNDWVTACKVKARGKFDIPFLEKQDENVSPIVEVAYQEEEISTPNNVLTDIDIDDVNIIFNVDQEELNEMEIEELRRVMNGKQVIVDSEELEEELEDFDEDEETQDETDCDSNNSDSELM
ncbi:uncharacterized protein LOC122019608 [Zingiber officinale]|uniref:uncharacterized protein LOC122019608 n=1 Tax=Zingiber officinale TaxID=94328 RepID=UPI001C4C1398|nr:uncharacterized protein LOC122019608 [Zingiber officinale]